MGAVLSIGLRLVQDDDFEKMMAALKAEDEREQTELASTFG